MKIFAIETSCDDTSCAVIDQDLKIISSVVQSQISVHKRFNGIVPELASRHHLENINFVIEETLKKAGCDFSRVDAFAVTTNPGLAGSLLVGAMSAKMLGFIYQKPVIPVNHLRAHVWANFLQDDNGHSFVPEFPAVILLVSGGHTELYLMHDYDKLEILGRTRDDACGEAFDKVAKLLDIGYPGGPVIDKISKNTKERIKLPVPLMPNTFDFSFSGLKTAVLYKVKDYDGKLRKEEKDIIAASFQEVAVKVLVRKTIDAAKKYNVKTIMLSGGVAANSELRDKMKTEAAKYNINLNYPPIKYCTDNAAMVGALGVYQFKKHGANYFNKKVQEDVNFLKIKP